MTARTEGLRCLSLAFERRRRRERFGRRILFLLPKILSLLRLLDRDRNRPLFVCVSPTESRRLVFARLRSAGLRRKARRSGLCESTQAAERLRCCTWRLRRPRPCALAS